MSHHRSVCAVVINAILLIALPCRGGSIAVGLLSFDSITAGAPGVAGVTGFGIQNLTGDPGFGGQALAPDFPVFSTLTFQNASLSYVVGGVLNVIQLGSLAPGVFLPADLRFPDTTDIESGTFQATLSSLTATLAGGSQVTFDSAIVQGVLAPASGNALQPGLDLMVLTAPANVPEPGTAGISVIALLCFAARILTRKPQ